MYKTGTKYFDQDILYILLAQIITAPHFKAQNINKEVSTHWSVFVVQKSIGAGSQGFSEKSEMIII